MTPIATTSMKQALAYARSYAEAMGGDAESIRRMAELIVEDSKEEQERKKSYTRVQKAGDNCGTGAGGFQAGNDCGSREGGGGDGKKPSRERKPIEEVLIPTRDINLLLDTVPEGDAVPANDAFDYGRDGTLLEWYQLETLGEDAFREGDISEQFDSATWDEILEDRDDKEAWKSLNSFGYYKGDGDEALSEALDKMQKSFETGIASCRLKENAMLFRGLSLPPEVVDEIVQTGVISHKGVQSWTTEKNIATNFARRGFIGQTQVVLALENPRVGMVNRANAMEREVLRPRGNLTVTRVVRPMDNDSMLIVVKESDE